MMIMFIINTSYQILINDIVIMFMINYLFTTIVSLVLTQITKEQIKKYLKFTNQF